MMSERTTSTPKLLLLSAFHAVSPTGHGLPFYLCLVQPQALCKHLMHKINNKRHKALLETWGSTEETRFSYLNWFCARWGLNLQNSQKR